MSISSIGSSASYYSNLQASGNKGQKPQPPDPQKMFDDADSDGSGGISVDEASSFMANMQSKMAEKMGTSSEVGDSGAFEISDEALEEAFGTADVDGDGELSSDEYASFMESMRPAGGPHGGGMPPPPPGQEGSEEESATSLPASGIDFGALLEALSSDEDSSNSSDLASYLAKMIENSYGATSGNTTTAASTVASTVSASA